ncbi:MAG: hypothetical protein KAS12_01245 [Candidatus Aenigmarchaeota archaeon]|nr:hypothetical protein [Candidatus Aenigmarchaeota archaeon]
MFIQKIYEVNLAIEDPILFMSKESNLIFLLKNKFEGKCFKSSLILEICKIIKQSECMITQNDMSASGIISVQFEAMAMIYEKGEVINDCKFVINDDLAMILSGKKCTIFMNNTPMTESYKIGQKISIIVNWSRYETNKGLISISGVPYLHNMFGNERYMKCVGDLSEEAIEAVMERYMNVKVKFDKIKTDKHFEHFEKLTDSYKTQQAKELDPKVLLSKSPEYVKLFVNGGFAILQTKEVKDVKFIEDTKTSVYGIIIDALVRKMEVIIGMCETYSEDDDIIKHENIWRSIEKSKL